MSMYCSVTMHLPVHKQLCCVRIKEVYHTWWSSYTSQTNLTLGVKLARARYGLLCVSAC